MSSKATRVMTSRKLSGAPRRSAQASVTMDVVRGMMAPKVITVPANPTRVTSSITVRKTVQVSIDVEAGVTTTLTVADVTGAIPGGQTYWTRVRFDTIKVWGASTQAGKEGDPLILLLPVDTSWDQPPLEAEDAGVMGQRRPAVGMRLGLLESARWFGTADTTILCRVRQSNVSPSDTQLVIQANLELMSPSPAI